MKVFVVVATKGRPKETYHLLTHLSEQSHPIESVIVVGHDAQDIDGLDQHALTNSGKATIGRAPIGSCHQRNAGLDNVAKHTTETDHQDWIVIFFDDDFRPAKDWISNAVEAFTNDKSLMGITGYVIADGVSNKAYSESDVSDFLSGKQAPALAAVTENITSLYGCNMAFRGTFSFEARFDEALPLYGWLEDVDYSRRALKNGTLAYVENCRGVHMGVSSGRTSGLRFGYSQVANPTFLHKKGTMPFVRAYTIMSKNILSNIFNTCRFNRKRDYYGRLKGNCVAIKDIARSKCSPQRILSLKA